MFKKNKSFFKIPLYSSLALWLSFIALIMSQSCRLPNEPQPTSIILTSTQTPSNTKESQIDGLTPTPQPNPSPTPKSPPPSPIVRPSPTAANFIWAGYIALIAREVSTHPYLPYLYRIGDKELTLVPPASNFVYPPNMDWSPDGQSLIFSSSAEYSPELYLFSLETSDVHKFETGLEGFVNFGDPAWSPNGQYLAFTQPVVVNDRLTLHIFVKQMETGDVHFVTEGSSPVWLPDNETLIFRRTHLDIQWPEGDIFRVNIDGSDLQQLTENTYANHPIVSRDGNLVLFTAYISPDGSPSTDIHDHALYGMKPDGTELTLLMRNLDGYVSWSPDGNYLLIAQDCRIYVIKWQAQPSSLRRQLLDLPNHYCYYFALLQP